jgi:23S rRNA pseudouridine2605 synthase
MAETPKSPTAGDRIAKVLSRAGIASRREAERMIEAGLVTVNGKPITSPALNVLPTDRITVEGKPVAAPEAARLWLYYKPEGLVTSAADEKGRETVFDNLPEDMPRVMSVGRLDLNSEGLLLLTNDGELKRRLELPSTGWLRKYRVRVKGNPTDVDLEPLRKGITLDGERFQPMTVSMDRHQGANAWLTVGLREGRNREIRRAMMAINLTVNRLIRVSYGPFRLGEMEPGQVEEVRPKVLRDQLGLSEAPEAKPARAANTRPGSAKPQADKPRGAKPLGAKPTGGKPAAATAAPRTLAKRPPRAR